jgi:hypothetical protein
VADAGHQASLEAAEVHITIRPEDKAAARKSKKPAEKK